MYPNNVQHTIVNYHTYEKLGNYDSILRKTVGNRYRAERIPMLILADNDFKGNIINLFMGLKEKMVIVNKYLRNLNKQIETILKS